VWSGSPLCERLREPLNHAINRAPASGELFPHLVEKVRSYDRDHEQELIAARDYEKLELYVMRHLLGVA
jgi:hypothetical protein